MVSDAADLLMFAAVVSTQRGHTDATAAQWRYVIASFSKHLGRPAKIADLSAANINAWLAALKTSAYTRSTQRSKLLAIRQAAIEERRLKSTPDRINRVRKPTILPRCWEWRGEGNELKRLLDHIATLPGEIRGVPRALFWRAFAIVAIDTGLRLGDLLKVGCGDLQPDGSLLLVQSKTRTIHTPTISAAGLCALRAAKLIDRPAFFGGIISLHKIGLRFREIRNAAGLQAGSIKWFRRTGATAVHATAPGRAWEYLGHSRPGLDRTSYVDPSKVNNQTPKPGLFA